MIYKIDLGLLIAAGTIAIVLTAKPLSSQPEDVEAGAATIAVSEVRAAASQALELLAEWVSYEEDDPGSQ
jgi:hypothetical protein